MVASAAFPAILTALGVAVVSVRARSAALLPATVVLWLGLEVTGFAFIDGGGSGHGGFSAPDPPGRPR